MPHIEGARAPSSSAQIVGYHSSKISFHFCNDCIIFCDGAKVEINDGNAILEQRLSGLVGKISLVGCNGLIGHHELIELTNGLVHHHMLIELNSLDGPNKLIELTASGHNELINFFTVEQVK
jgi:hypothetical protein